MIKNLAVLGSTGSVGQSTLEVIRHNKDKFNPYGVKTDDVS